MKVRVEVVCLKADGAEQRRQVLTIERRELAMETLGYSSDSSAIGPAVITGGPTSLGCCSPVAPTC